MLRMPVICGSLLACLLPASAAWASSPFFLFFDSGSARIDARARPIVDNAAQTILNLDARQVVIEGYADRRGSVAVNLRMSRRRAEAVRAALGARGVPSATITVRAFGESDLLTATADGVSEPENRYVLIFLSQLCRPWVGPALEGC